MENKNNAIISDSYYNIDRISQFRLGDNSQKSQKKPFP